MGYGSDCRRFRICCCVKWIFRVKTFNQGIRFCPHSVSGLTQKKDFVTISKETQSLNMPWEQEYGYSQAVKVGNTIYLSGQVSHDDMANSELFINKEN
jgi:enamine deaminase RidA (YjgF/YER057c/UK114 family)